MIDYLVFRLYGTLASWGDIAVGEIRPSYRYPSKSAVIGLIAAALGFNRDESKKQTELSKLLFSTRIDALGSPIDDYHTIQAPSEQAIKNDRGTPFWTRIDEIEAMKWRVMKTRNNKEAGAVQSRRTYYCDSVYTVALSESRSAKISWGALKLSSIHELVSKIKYPEFTLYLGRKSCPLSIPMQPQITTAENCIEAFRLSKFKFTEELSQIADNSNTVQYYSEEKLPDTLMKLTRRDQPVNRSTWQFTERDEYYYTE